MYAKLIVGGTVYTHFAYMRDIVKLVTSETPTLNDVSAFSNTSSVLVDATPAGWTLVGSTNVNDRITIPPSRTTLPAVASNTNLIISAPCIDEVLPSKYAVFSTAGGTLNSIAFTLAAASNATNAGVTTNESTRLVDNANPYTSHNRHLYANTGSVFHVFSNPRHITVVVENKGLMGVWEASATDLNYFYNTAPQINYSHPYTTDTQKLYYSTGIIAGQPLSTGTISIATGTSVSGNHSHSVVKITDPNTANVYSSIDLTDSYYDGTNAPYPRRNIGSMLINVSNKFNNTLNQSGQLRYLISPIYFSVDQYGYATQFVSGISPIYFAKNGIGLSGDTVTINNNQYYYIDCGNYGLMVAGS